MALDADIAIRPYAAEDAPQLSELYFASARTLGVRRYTPEQTRAWAPGPVDPRRVHARASDGRLTLVAVASDGMILAYGDLEADGHIDHLYAHPLGASRGIASAIVDALVEHAVSVGMPRLHVEASELARGLFDRRGFTLVQRRDFILNGVAIHNYAMARVLTTG